MSGKIVVAQGRDLIKTKKRIDISGQEIDPVTKKVIEPVEKPYVPTPEEMAAAQRKTEAQPSAGAGPGGLNEIITQKLQEKIGDAIGDALGKMDLGDLIGQAIDKALKK